MEPAQMSLDALGQTFGTDKCSFGHDYLRFYETYFDGIRRNELNVLEIGVANGASLAVWEAYFPNSRIVGADINPAARRFARDRVYIEILDQSNKEELLQLGIAHGRFDIIIEDGSHMWGHQITSLRTLFPLLRAGGIYIVEDLQTNYGEMAAQFKGDSPISCMEYLKRLVDVRVGDSLDCVLAGDTFLSAHKDEIDVLVFYRHSCLIRKGSRRVHNEPLMEVGPTLSAISLVAHIGQWGDMRSDTGIVRGEMYGRNSIQGFYIVADGMFENCFDYRARLANGEWTEWVPCGEFVGTRGKGEDLTGFSVRIAGPVSQTHEVIFAGLFRGFGVVVASDGEECVSPVERAQLWAMQLAVRRK